MPRVIGVVTSPTGAVIRDILHRLKERFPVHVLVWPVLVQGESAAAEITAAIDGFDAFVNMPADGMSHGLPTPDVLIIARGGGSLEDLMAFNDENVVRAVARCRLPVISLSVMKPTQRSSTMLLTAVPRRQQQRLKWQRP